MNKTTLLLAFLFTTVFSISSRAQSSGTTEVVNDYSFGFDSYQSIGFTDDDYSYGSYASRSHHDFAPTGWGHIVDVSDDGWDETYVTYTFDASSGTDGSGCLRAGTQDVEDFWGDATHLNDFLVTPIVKSGTVSLKVRQYQSGGYVEFYKATKEFDGFNVDTETGKIDVPTVSLSDDEYTTITFNVSEDTYIGIKASNVYIDDFTASAVEITKTPGLTIKKIIDENGDYNDADADGNVTLNYKVVLNNSGLVDFATGDKGYSLDLTNGKDGDVIASFNNLPALAAGATDTVDISTTIKASDYTSPFDAYVKENITNTSLLASNVNITPYETRFAFTLDGDTTSLKDKYDFGISKSDIVRNFLIRNNGAAPLTINSITVPDGFEGNYAIKEIAAHGTLPVTVTVKGNTGNYDGNLVVKVDGVDYTIALSAIIANPDSYFEDFENSNVSYDTTLPDGFVDSDPGNWRVEGYVENTLKEVGNKIDAFTYNGESTLITPMLDIADGEGITFYAAKRSSRSHLEVLYSKDRKNWIKAGSIVTADSAEAYPTASVFTEDNIPGSYTNYYKFSRFSFNTIPAGKWYIGFKGNNVRIDNILGGKRVDLDHDVFVSKTDIPIKSMVNKVFQAKATLYNANAKAEDDSYTANFYLDGALVATTGGKAVEPNSSTELTFDVTPHKDGLQKAYALFVFGNDTVSSDTTEINISAEVASSEVQIGTPSGNGVVAPLDLTNKYSEGVVLLTADRLGLKPGTVINSLTFKGVAQKSYYKTEEPEELELSNLKVWIDNSELNVFPEVTSDFDMNTVIDTTKAEQVYNDAYTVKDAGTGTGSNYSGYEIQQSGDLITIDFAEPFTYTGNSIVLAAKHASASYDSYFFLEADTSSAVKAACRSGWSDLASSDWTYIRQSHVMPVIYFGVETEVPVLKGVVKGEDKDSDGVAGAVVTITSNNVEYTTTTDETGNYSINVIQGTLPYKLTVTKDGYEEYSDSIAITEGGLVKDINLVKVHKFITGTVTDKATGNAIAGATITLKNGDVEAYTATTDNDGKYEIRVTDLAPTYEAIITAEGYVPDTINNVKFADDDLVIDAQLETETPNGINAIHEDGTANGNVYTIDGKFVGRNINTADLPRGLYIIGTKKISIK